MNKHDNVTQCTTQKLSLSGGIPLLKLGREQDADILTMNPEITSELILITKSPDIVISNEICKAFKGHNLIEYKFPNSQTVNKMFLKVFGDACLYVSHPDNHGTIGMDDITISIVLDGSAEKIISQIRQEGYTLDETGKGIYQVKDPCLFDIQLIITGHLNMEEHSWLETLITDFEKENAPKLTLPI